MEWTVMVITLLSWEAVSGSLPFVQTEYDGPTIDWHKEIFEFKKQMTDMKQELQDIKNNQGDMQGSLEAGFEDTFSMMKENFGEGMPDLKGSAKKGFNSLREGIMSELSAIRDDIEQLRGEHKDNLEDKITALNSTLIKALFTKPTVTNIDVSGNFSCDNSMFQNVPHGLDVCGEVVSQGQCGQNLWYLYHCCRSCQAAGMVPDGALPINRAWDRTVDYSRG
ncbi:unnamed protein product [Meganyctiphanes norvegica]|uniref:Uncharacterized protein n=1 Tax=Meganyctiphanes norvegica TaxID=48144 RepID=A0AAV2QQP4_MEGNR